MEIFKTILAGIFVYVLGQFILKLVIEPLQNLIKEIEKTNSLLTYYKLTYSNFEQYPGLDGRKSISNIAEQLREQASLISSQSSIIIGFALWNKIKLLPSEEAIKKIVKNLFDLAQISLNDVANRKIKKNDADIINETINLLNKVENK